MYHPVFKLNLFNVTEVSFKTELCQDVSVTYYHNSFCVTLM